MTTTTKTKYSVVFHYAAEDWKDCCDDDGNFDYDNQPTYSTDEIRVELDSDASPWEVYGEAEALEEFIHCSASNPDVYSWDSDGMTISFDGKCLSLSGEMIKPETTWSDFY